MEIYGIVIEPQNPNQKGWVCQVRVTPISPATNGGSRVDAIDFNPTLVNSQNEQVDPLNTPREAVEKILGKYHSHWHTLLILACLPTSLGWCLVSIVGLVVALVFSLGGQGFLSFQLFRLPFLSSLPEANIWVGLGIGGIITILALVLAPPLRNYLCDWQWWRAFQAYYRERHNRKEFLEKVHWEVCLAGLPSKSIVEGPSLGLAFFFAFLDAVLRIRPECKVLFWPLTLERHFMRFVAVGEVTSDGEVRPVGDVSLKLETLLAYNYRNKANPINVCFGANKNEREWQTAWEKAYDPHKLRSAQVGQAVYRARDNQAADESINFYFFSHTQNFLTHLIFPLHWEWAIYRAFSLILVAVLFIGAIPGPPIPDVTLTLIGPPVFQGGDEPYTRLNLNETIKIAVKKTNFLGCLEVTLRSIQPTMSQRSGEGLQKSLVNSLCFNEEMSLWFKMPGEPVLVCATARDIGGRRVQRKCIRFELISSP